MYTASAIMPAWGTSATCAGPATASRPMHNLSLRTTPCQRSRRGRRAAPPAHSVWPGAAAAIGAIAFAVLPCHVALSQWRPSATWRGGGASRRRVSRCSRRRFGSWCVCWSRAYQAVFRRLWDESWSARRRSSAASPARCLAVMAAIVDVGEVSASSSSRSACTGPTWRTRWRSPSTSIEERVGSGSRISSAAFSMRLGCGAAVHPAHERCSTEADAVCLGKRRHRLVLAVAGCHERRYECCSHSQFLP